MSIQIQKHNARFTVKRKYNQTLYQISSCSLATPRLVNTFNNEGMWKTAFIFVSPECWKCIKFDSKLDTSKHNFYMYKNVTLLSKGTSTIQHSWLQPSQWKNQHILPPPLVLLHTAPPSPLSHRSNFKSWWRDSTVLVVGGSKSFIVSAITSNLWILSITRL